MAKDFDGAFTALRAMLLRHGDGMLGAGDAPGRFMLNTPATGTNGKPMMFASVLVGKSAVSFHLFPLYFNPKLEAAIPAALLPRKQGKTCFNFQRPDDALFADLEVLTALARKHFEKAGYLKAGVITPEKMNAMLAKSGVDIVALAKTHKRIVTAANAKRAATKAKKATKKATKTSKNSK